MLRYCFGQEYVETRPASDEDREHVRFMLAQATRRLNRVRAVMAVCILAMVIALALMFSFGLAIFLIDLVVLPRVILAYRDARKPLPLLRASQGLTHLAIYGEQSDRRCALHPTTLLLLSQGGKFVSDAICVEGVSAVEQETYPDTGWYPPERELDYGLDRRPLSPAEVVELKNLAAHIRPKGSVFLFLAGWVCLGGILSVFDKKDPTPPMVAWLSLLGLISIIGLHLYRNIPALQYRRDRAAKEVVRVEYEGTRIEYLPHSHVIWTEDGQPSQIRREGVYRLYYVEGSHSKQPRGH